MQKLSPDIEAACAPLFEALPPDRAMPHLLGSHVQQAAIVAAVESALRSPALADRSDLAAGLWLYVDDLDRSHAISQSLDDVTGAYWHGIMHRREGDFANSHYWMRRAARHPLRQEPSDLDPDTLIDQVSAARGSDVPALVEQQRQEWQALFTWCATHKG